MSESAIQIGPNMTAHRPAVMAEEKRRGTLGRYVRAQLRAMVSSNSKLTPLQVLSDTDLAYLFVALCIKGRTDASTFRRMSGKFPGVPAKVALQTLKYFRLHAAPLVTSLQSSKTVKHNPALRAALKYEKRRLEKAAKKIDAYVELQWALATQRKKLEALVLFEKKSKWLVDRSHAAMELFVKTAKEIVELEMKLGVRDIVPDEVNVKVYQSVSGYIEHKIEPIGKNKMLEATRRFTQLLDSPAFDAEYEEVKETP